MSQETKIEYISALHARPQMRPSVLTLAMTLTSNFEQALAWANVDHELCHYMTSFGQDMVKVSNIVSICMIRKCISFIWSCDQSIPHMPGGRFKNTYELLNLRALKYSHVNKIHIFQCVGEIFCVEFQRYPLKFHTKYLTHSLKDIIFMQHWNFKSS